MQQIWLPMRLGLADEAEADKCVPTWELVKLFKDNPMLKQVRPHHYYCIKTAPQICTNLVAMVLL